MADILTIIQARQNSTRLPNKVLEVFAGDYLIAHIIKRIQYAKYVDRIIVATGPEHLNTGLIDVCQNKLGVEVFCGDENDVLNRFYAAAKPSSPDVIVRVTADDPLKDPDVIDRAVDILLNSQKDDAPGYDYVSNTIRPSYPEGLDIEVCTFAALERAYKEAELPSEREHVMPYIWKHADRFRLHNFEYSSDLSNMRWTVDFPEDLEFVKKIYDHFGGRNNFVMHDILQFLKENPGLSRTNEDVERNQSYNKMVANEQSH